MLTEKTSRGDAAPPAARGRGRKRTRVGPAAGVWSRRDGEILGAGLRARRGLARAAGTANEYGRGRWGKVPLKNTALERKQIRAEGLSSGAVDVLVGISNIVEGCIESIR